MLFDLARGHGGLGALQQLATYERAVRLLNAALGPDHDEVCTITEHRRWLASTTADRTSMGGV